MIILIQYYVTPFMVKFSEIHMRSGGKENMKINNKLAAVTVLIAVMITAVAISQADSYSAKTAIGIDTNQLIGADGPTTQLMTPPIYIHTSQQKDLVISVTSQNTLVTDTTLKGSKGETDSVSIKVKVVVDEGNFSNHLERVALPGEVTFASRIQEIKGRLSDATYVYNETSGEYEWLYEPEWVEIILNTTSANGFNFVLQDLGSGDHEIRVYAMIETDTGDTPDSSVAAVIGPRTVVINEVRLA